MSKADGPNSSARTSCMFYKLMVASILQEKKLRIPEKFAKKYGDELSCVATLTVPNGRIWVVEVEKINKKLWFCSGWHEFVEFYSIRVGYFLVFRYEAESNFNVCIFDLTVSEIRYPCNVRHNLQEPRHDSSCIVADKKHVVDDDLTGILCSGNPCHTSISMSELLDRDKLLPSINVYDFSQNIRHSRDIGIQFNESDFTSSAIKVEMPVWDEMQGKGGTQGRTRSGKLRTDNLMDRRTSEMKIACQVVTRRWRPVTAEEKQRTIDASYMFKPDNPFFRVILRPSYVYKGFLLHVPSSFARRYFTDTRCLTLQNSEGKEWSVRCVCTDNRAKLSKGWTEFAWENNLEEGDVCVFELIKMNILKVTIFRVLEVRAPVDRLPSINMTKLNN